jgi:small-conductance mechanosensitive channel/CRP-like cAMP-binding protein
MLPFCALLAGLLLAGRIWGAAALHRLGAPADVIVIAIVGFLLSIAVAALIDGLIRRLFWRAYFRAVHGHEAPALLRDLATILVFLLSLSVWLYVDLDFSAAGIFAASGATAVVIGLALQAMILDLFSGLSINLDRSYAIGDWLTVHSEELTEPVYGRVEGITWRCTMLRLEDGRCILLPNRLVTSNPVTNHSRPAEPKRLSVEVKLDVRQPSARVSTILLGEAIKAVSGEGLAAQPAPTVLLRGVDGDASHYEIRFYADPNKISPSEACSAMLTALTSAIHRAGLPLPVQQVELSEELPALDEAPAVRDALARVPLFAKALNAEQLDALAAHAEPVSFGTGGELMAQGAQDSSMFVILEGAARVQIDAQGGLREIAVLAGGDVAGEMSLMTGAPRSATVTALTSLRALRITKETIETLLAASPELLERFSAILAEREAQLKAQASQTERWDFVERDLLARMRTFFARAFSGTDKRAG